MEFITDWLASRDHWDWFIFALVLLICELFGAGLYLFWIGIAAGIVGALQYVFPTMDWQMQWILFAALSLSVSFIWWKIQKKVQRHTDQPNLNERSSSFVGKTYFLKTAIVQGRGQINIDDSLWDVVGEDLPENTKVRVIGNEDMLLKVERAD